MKKMRFVRTLPLSNLTLCLERKSLEWVIDPHSQHHQLKSLKDGRLWDIRVHLGGLILTLTSPKVKSLKSRQDSRYWWKDDD